MRCYEHGKPGDYNASWFATFECSSHCQLLATIKCYCAPPLGAFCHLQQCCEWCQAHPLTPCLRGGTLVQGVPRSKHPPLPLIFLRPPLSLRALSLNCFCPPTGPGAGFAALQLSVWHVFLHLVWLCASLPSHVFIRLWVTTGAPELSCTLSILESQSKSYYLGQFLLFFSLVLILQIINLNEGGLWFSTLRCSQACAA